MIIGLLFIISGVLLCFTGIGLVVGIPMVLIGFVILIIAAVGGVAGSLLPRRSSPVSDTSYAHYGRPNHARAILTIAIIVGLIFAITVLSHHA